MKNRSKNCAGRTPQSANIVADWIHYSAKESKSKMGLGRHARTSVYRTIDLDQVWQHIRIYVIYVRGCIGCRFNHTTSKESAHCFGLVAHNVPPMNLIKSRPIGQMYRGPTRAGILGLVPTIWWRRLCGEVRMKYIQVLTSPWGRNISYFGGSALKIVSAKEGWDPLIRPLSEGNPHNTAPGEEPDSGSKIPHSQ